jgi:hypothetical protein
MATKTIKVSDLTGAEIREEENLARIVVEEHPTLSEPVTLEVLPEEVEEKLPEVEGYVRISYHPSSAGGGEPQEFVITLEEFNSLSTEFDIEAVLESALRTQHEEEGRRRGRRRRGRGGGRPRVDYTSPEHAGEPHRGRITDEEKQYVRENLNSVNARLREQGMREIDPSDPQMAERYDLGLAP